MEELKPDVTQLFEKFIEVANRQRDISSIWTQLKVMINQIRHNATTHGDNNYDVLAELEKLVSEGHSQSELVDKGFFAFFEILQTFRQVSNQKPNSSLLKRAIPISGGGRFEEKSKPLLNKPNLTSGTTLPSHPPSCLSTRATSLAPSKTYLKNK